MQLEHLQFNNISLQSHNISLQFHNSSSQLHLAVIVEIMVPFRNVILILFPSDYFALTDLNRSFDFVISLIFFYFKKCTSCFSCKQPSDNTSVKPVTVMQASLASDPAMHQI